MQRESPMRVLDAGDAAVRATTTLSSLFAQSFQANLITQQQRSSSAAAASHLELRRSGSASAVWQQ